MAQATQIPITSHPSMCREWHQLSVAARDLRDDIGRVSVVADMLAEDVTSGAFLRREVLADVLQDKLSRLIDTADALVRLADGDCR